MNTYLGSAALLEPADIEPELVESSQITYLEGYLFSSPESKAAFYRASEIAKSAGQRVALSLSDQFCVEHHREAFQDLVQRHIDILFANEPEIKSLYETEDFGSALNAIGSNVEIACVTRGAAGSIIIADHQRIEIKATPISKVVDTTGAGDLYAAGFLYGLTHNLDLAECGRIASIAAGEIISHVGPRPETKLADLLSGND